MGKYAGKYDGYFSHILQIQCVSIDYSNPRHLSRIAPHALELGLSTFNALKFAFSFSLQLQVSHIILLYVSSVRHCICHQTHRLHFRKKSKMSFSVFQNF